MIESITISNYRCYNYHTIDFKKLTLVVGKNNAGKSTLIESLRLISIAVNKFESSTYCDAPKWADLPRIAKGISPSIKAIEINTENIFHKYGAPPSIIKATFSNNFIVTIFIGESVELFCTLETKPGIFITKKSEASKLNLWQVNILPQITPINKKERVLNRDYVRINLNSDISSLHFRNQLYLLNEYFPRFCDLAETTWLGLRVLDIETYNNNEKVDLLSLMIQDNSFVAEVGWMGHGLQMWLQIMWFLSRINQDELVILDEPDVYMHPDLQRKLIKLLISNYKQVIVSTHSVEIISEVEAENILVIDNNKQKSLFANNVPVVQRILNSIGSIHNLQLTKLWSTKKLLIVEGEDISILKRLQKTLNPSIDETFDIIPNFDIGGWGGWNYAKGSSMLLKNTVDKQIKIYCIFDSDYHTKSQIKERIDEAKAINVNIHIWEKKEIENYLIVPTAIIRIIKAETKKNVTITVEDVRNKISEILKENEEDIIDNFATEIQSQNRKLAVTTLRKEAKEYINSLSDRISGKKLMSELNKWLHLECKVTINPIKLSKNLEKHEINEEIKNIISKIDNNESF